MDELGVTRRGFFAALLAVPAAARAMTKPQETYFTGPDPEHVAEVRSAREYLMLADGDYAAFSRKMWARIDAETERRRRFFVGNAWGRP